MGDGDIAGPESASAPASDAPAEARPIRLNYRWLLGSLVLGAAVVILGWLANRLWTLPTIEAIAIDVGAALGLAGVLWALEHRFEQRLEQRLEEQKTRLEERLDEVAGQLTSESQFGLADRRELLDVYRQRVKARPPSSYVPEEQILAEADRRQKAHEDHVAAVAIRADAALAAQGRTQNKDLSFLRMMQREEALAEDPPPPRELDDHPSDPLDPREPVDDWWASDGYPSWASNWREAFTARRLPVVPAELRTRSELTALYAATVDGANGLRVYQVTSAACSELLAIALDAHHAHFPEAHSWRAHSPASRRDARSRWERASAELLPVLVGRAGEMLADAEAKSDARHRLVRSRTWLKVQAARRDSSAESRLARRNFARWLTFPLLHETLAAVAALHLPEVELPEVRAFDLSPAQDGPFVWDSHENDSARTLDDSDASQP